MAGILERYRLLTRDFMSVILDKTNRGGRRGPQSVDGWRAAQPPKAASGGSRHARRNRIPVAGDRASQAFRRDYPAWRVLPAPLLHAAAELHSRVRAADRHESRSAALGVPSLQS